MKTIIYCMLGLLLVTIFWLNFAPITTEGVGKSAVIPETPQDTTRDSTVAAKAVNETGVGIESRLQERLPILSFRSSYDGTLYRGAKTVKEHQVAIAEQGDALQLMEFSRGIGALLAMYEASDSIHYLAEALELSEKIVGNTRPGKEIANNPKAFQDDYLGWVNHNPRYEEIKRGGPHLREVPLYESYLFRYLAKMSYLVKTANNPNIDDELKATSDRLLSFVRVNGWQKWYERGQKISKGCYPYLFRSRTHMTSHWAIVALYLREMSDDEQEKKQYSKLLSLYDQQLKSNLHLTKDSAYVWNMTWDNPWPLNTACNPAAEHPIIQDVSHGNHVVTYIVEAYEIGTGVWEQKDIQAFSNTIKYVIYDPGKNRFNGDLNGQFIPKVATGIQMADGFVKLARYDKELLQLFDRVRTEQYDDFGFSLYEPQYVAELMFAQKFHH